MSKLGVKRRTAVTVATAGIFWCFVFLRQGYPARLVVSATAIWLIVGVTVVVWVSRSASRRGSPAASTGLAPGFLNWYSAGEDAAIAVYKRRLGAVAWLEAAVLILLWFVVRQRGHPQTFWAVVAWVIIGNVGQRRSALILTAEEAIYRPEFGRLVRVRLLDITGISPSSTTRLFAFRPLYVRAVRLSLSGGGARVIPLDFRDWREIVDKLAAPKGLAVPSWGPR